MSGPLSEQVGLLGDLLGRAIRERGGAEALALVDDLRLACREAALTGDPGPRREAAGRIAGLSLEQIGELLRAYTTFFRLVNEAEQREIVRVNRERSRESGPRARPGSIAWTVADLAEAGMGPDAFLDLLGRMEVVPTFTAHPTEARRGSVLGKQWRIADLLAALQDPDLTPEEEERARAGLYDQIVLLLATREVRAERPTVRDEVEQGLYFLERSVWDAVPRIHEDVERGFRQVFGREPENLPPFLRYRSWIGGDRDGNPNVTADVTRWTIATHRSRAARLHLRELQALRDELSISASEAEVPAELLESIEQDIEALELPQEVIAPWADEPYRQKVVCMMARLERVAEAAQQRAEGDSSDEPEAYDAAAFVADLALLDRCLRATGFAEVARSGHLMLARRLAASFGLHLAALDLREHSGAHERAVADLLRLAGVAADYASLSEEEKLAILTRELEGARPLRPPGAELGEDAQRVLDAFETVREALELESRSVGSYIVSMTHALSDVLEPMLLAREVGLWRVEEDRVHSGLDFVPLYETIEDLEKAGERLGALFEHPVYRRQLEARGGLQEVMLGYSDSNKDGGYWMANRALRDAQEGIGRACREAGVELRLFHGRGGSVGRGGGRSNRAILAMPPLVQNGRFRATEQGEVISFRYSRPEIAHRHLEQIVSAVLRGAASSKSAAGEGADGGEAAGERIALVAAMAERGIGAYREFLGAEEFWPWYLRATPIRHISRLPLASRPASRGGGEVRFEGLRAIPWNFAWIQTRYLVPGWFGTGQALGPVVEDPSMLEACRAMYRSWPFFTAVIDDAQREMARARLDISRRYDELALEEEERTETPAPTGIHERIAAEFDRAHRALLAVTEQKTLLDNEPVIQESIRLRNPYTDVLNLLQIELLHRWRRNGPDDRERLASEILLSLNGIAAAMQSTG